MTTSVSLFKHARDVRTFAAGEQLFAPGDPGDVMYGILEGEVEIKIGETVLETVTEGGLVGEMALIDQKPRSAAAIARTDVKAAVVDEKQFTYMVQQTPYFAIQVMRVLVERLRHMDEHGVKPL